MIIIPRNTPLPAKNTRGVVTRYECQERMRYCVTQGDDRDPEFVVVVGESTLDLPIYPKGAPFDVTYSYDLEQIVHVEVTDRTTGLQLGTFEIERVSNLKKSQVEEAKKRIGGMTIM